MYRNLLNNYTDSFLCFSCKKKNANIIYQNSRI